MFNRASVLVGASTSRRPISRPSVSIARTSHVLTVGIFIGQSFRGVKFETLNVLARQPALQSIKVKIKSVAIISAHLNFVVAVGADWFRRSVEVLQVDAGSSSVRVAPVTMCLVHRVFLSGFGVRCVG